MGTASFLSRLRRSFVESAGTVVFGMEDGTVSIFGLVFGVAATTTSSVAVLVAGASGAAAAAVSMMAGVYLDAETRRDELAARQAHSGPDRAPDDPRHISGAVAAACGCGADAAIIRRGVVLSLAGGARRHPRGTPGRRRTAVALDLFAARCL